ncbi:MAG: UV DNA damage repair endonuclease UvsE [Eubacteriales bacterium]
MSIGYACLTIGVLHTDIKSCIKKNISEEKLIELTDYNLNSLENIIDYNIENDIRLFRISSDIIPFGSSPLNTLDWRSIFSSRLCRIGQKIKDNGIRVSMHPGQYTVLNSPDTEVAANAAADLIYHTNLLDSLELNQSHKIVLHIGGVYQDKKTAINRFIINYNHLTDAVKARIVLENDDRSYHIGDVLEIGALIHAPVIFDNLHNKLNAWVKTTNETDLINLCGKTWDQNDGRQKIHYSQQSPAKKTGSHSETISVKEFMQFYDSLENSNLDIMLEVKDKNLSAIKCINCTTQNKNIKILEKEWSRYKYTILEKAPENYLKIRKLLKNKINYPAVEFYDLTEDALRRVLITGKAINAALHVWGYFKNQATDSEKKAFKTKLDNFNNGISGINSLKRYLYKLSQQYQQSYLLNSYYFVL